MQIRDANPSDFRELVRICKFSFPFSPRWQGAGSVAEKWLDFFVKTDSCRIVVNQEHEKVNGFAVIVMDIDAFNRQKKEIYTILTEKLMCYLMNPTLFISKLIYKPSTNKKSEKGSTENIDWIELMAISPQIKCKGIGSKLIQYCIAIAKESSKDAVKLSIKKKNIPAISFYKKASFERSGESKDSFVFNHTCQTQTAEISK